MCIRDRSISDPNKNIFEDILFKEISNRLHKMQGKCILKLTIPDIPNTYLPLINVHQCERMVGLSGGYDMEQACVKLSLNRHMQASFSRALSEGLYYHDSDEYFETAISKNISLITEASSKG